MWWTQVRVAQAGWGEVSGLARSERGHTGAAASSTAAHPPSSCLPHLPPSIPAVFMHDNFRPGNRTDESSMVVVTKTHVYAVDGDSDEEE